MSGRIPQTIKLQVLRMWINGKSRDAIAREVDIGHGSVSRVIAHFTSKDISDLDLIRQVALKIKNEGSDLIDVASCIRLSNFLKEMELSEEDLEQLLEVVHVYCFKNNQDFHDFVGVVDKIQEFESDFNISISEIPALLKQTREELYQLSGYIMTKTLYPNQKFDESQTIR